MSIEVSTDGFDFTGHLTPAGKENMWLEIDRGFKKFALDKITL